MLDGHAGDAVLANKAYDSDALRAIIAAMDAKAVPSNRSRKVVIPHDAIVDRQRRIERCFSKLEHLRGFATCDNRRTVHSQASFVSPPPSSGYAQ